MITENLKGSELASNDIRLTMFNTSLSEYVIVNKNFVQIGIIIMGESGSSNINNKNTNTNSNDNRNMYQNFFFPHITTL